MLNSWCSMEQLTDYTFDRTIIQSKIPIIVDFRADWCKPCKTIEPMLQQLAILLRGKIGFAKIDIENDQRIAGSLGVMNLPTLIFFKDGEELGRMVGSISKASLLEKIDEFFKEHRK